MIREVDIPCLSDLGSLAPEAEAVPEAFAVLSGTNPGRVFIDDPDTPRAALVRAAGIEGYYLVGDATSPTFAEHLDAWVAERIAPEARRAGLDWFELSGDGPEWDAAVDRIFASREMTRTRQCIYGPARPPAPCVLAGPEELRRLDHALLADPGVAQREILDTMFRKFWGGAERFFAHGLGFAVLRGPEVASVCCSGFVAGSVHAIHVETAEEHRRRGFARAAVRAFLEECSARDLTPHWDCMEDNEASRALAERAGLTLIRKYTLHSFRL
jgi:GNAT superfamily N-acetyltransferase